MCPGRSIQLLGYECQIWCYLNPVGDLIWFSALVTMQRQEKYTNIENFAAVWVRSTESGHSFANHDQPQKYKSTRLSLFRSGVGVDLEGDIVLLCPGVPQQLHSR